MRPSRYLEFRLYCSFEKTQAYHVISKKHFNLLGVIRWYFYWRQYTFWPEPDTVWNPECLDDVSGFIRELMEDRKKGKAI